MPSPSSDAATASSVAGRPRGPIRRLFRGIGVALCAVVTLAVTGWCALAITYAPIGPSAWTGAVAALFVLAVGWTLWRGRFGARAWFGVCLGWSGVLVWFLFLPAPAQGDWLPECSIAPEVAVVGDQVTVRSVRDFDWRSETEFDARWEDRTYDVSKLRTADFFLSFWGPKLICHTFVSFGFERPDRTIEHVAVSIEVRKRLGQDYSAVGGMFRQFPLIYIWADEADIVRVRTNFRGEHVYRYRLRMAPERMREVFLRYATVTEHLRQDPRWYNAATSSCGVDILRTAWGHRVPWFPSFKQMFNGLWEQEAYDEGALDNRVPFDELRARAEITQEAKAATRADFSKAIRARTVWLGTGHGILVERDPESDAPPQPPQAP